MLLNGYKSPSYLKIEEKGDEYPGKIVYLIKEFGYYNGFFSEFLFLLKKLLFCDAHGFVPFVDWGSNLLYFEPEGVDGEKNAFLHYYNRISEIEDASKASFVVTADDPHLDWVYEKYGCYAYQYPDEYMDALSGMAKKYVSLNDKLKAEFTKLFEEMTGNKKTLAVHFRGTGYRREYNRHPKFITVVEEIEKVNELIEEKGYEKVFLATDEVDAINKFKDAFGDKLIYFDDVRRAESGDESVAFTKTDKPGEKYRLGYEVVRDQYFPTECDGLVCGISNITIAARILRKAWCEKSYEDLVVIDHGFNENDNRFANAGH